VGLDKNCSISLVWLCRQQVAGMWCLVQRFCKLVQCVLLTVAWRSAANAII
jgi:hypothetical protein